MNKNTVHYRCEEYSLAKIEYLIEKSISDLGGIEKFVLHGERIFLKMNLLMKKKPEEAVTTHPLVVEAVVNILQRAGAEVTLGDSPGGPFTAGSLQRIYRATGMEAVALKTGAKLNFDTSEVEVSFPEGKLVKRFTLCRAMVEADKLVSLSKLKTHQMMRYTGAVKVLFGAIPGLLKVEFHMKMPALQDFADMLVDLALCVKPVLHVIDGIVGMEGHGPSSGDPRFAGSIFVGTDPFALDWAALRLMNIEPLSVPTVRSAWTRGIFREESEPFWLGDELIPVEPPFVAPEIHNQVRFRLFKKVFLPTFITESLRPKPEFSREICVGCGDCARNCPPQVITLVNNFPEVDLNNCIRCFCCQELCPHKAVRVRRSILGRLMKK